MENFVTIEVSAFHSEDPQFNRKFSFEIECHSRKLVDVERAFAKALGYVQEMGFDSITKFTVVNQGHNDIV